MPAAQHLPEKPPMKYILIGLMLMSGSAFAYPDTPVPSKSSAQAMVLSAGYVCSKVDAVTPFIASNGYTIYCNDFSYAYEVSLAGGQATLKAK